MIKKQLHKDILLIIILLIISYVAVYIVPNIVRPIIFLGMIVIFIRSKNNVPWIVFFFLLFSAPATLFYYSHDRWFLFLTSTVGVPFSFLVSISFLIKGLKRKENKTNLFSFERKLYLFYIVVLFIIGLMHGGLSFVSVFMLITIVPNILLFIFLPVLIDMKKDAFRIKKLLFIFTNILFLIQTYEIIFGKPLFEIGGSIIFTKDGLQRNITGIYFVFFSFILALSDLLSNKSKVNLLTVITTLTSIVLILNSGTRGWIIAMFFIMISILMFGSKTKTILIGLSTLGVITIFSFFISEKYHQKYSGNIYSSFERVLTVADIFEGDKTAGGTLSRLSSRGPRVMNQFYKNPIFGNGLSDKMFEYYDGHVANQSNLMQSGLIGFVLLYLIIIRILWKIFKFYFFLKDNNIMKLKILSMVIGFLGIIIIHFSSQQMFGYIMRNDKSMLIGFWFLFTFYYINNAISYERKSRYRNYND